MLEELEPELVDPGLYEKNQAFHLFSATSSKLEVKWNESFASFDSGLMSAKDKMNSSIKYVAATDKNNPDLKGKQRAVYFNKRYLIWRCELEWFWQNCAKSCISSILGMSLYWRTECLEWLSDRIWLEI